MLYIYLRFIVPLKSFSLMWRRYYWLWRTSNFDLFSAHSIYQWGFLIVPRILWHGLYLFIFEDPWHSHLLPNVWQQSCNYVFNGWSLSRPRIEFRPPECKANALKLFIHVFSSLLNIYPIADGWTIRKWYNYLHVCLQESGNKFQSRGLCFISFYHATAAVAQW